MHRFKVGQKVVALRTHKLGVYIKGKEYIIDGFACCPYCADPKLFIVGISEIVNINYTGCCGRTENNVRYRFSEKFFAPLQNNADAIEYRLNVSIKELEVKEYQSQ